MAAKCRIFVNCRFCGNELEITPSRKRKAKDIFCNKDCFTNWKKENSIGAKNPHWNRKQTICNGCKKKIFVPKSKIDKKHHFCRNVCYLKWLRKNQRVGANNSNWRSVERKCDFCREKIYVTPYKLKTTKLHFCNKTCFDNWERINKPRGKDSPIWNSIPMNCKNCGKEIFVQPSKLKLVKNIFCSDSCHNDWQRRNAPRGETHPRWKQKSLICDSCGKEISRSPAFINNHNFCSTSCYYNWKRKNTPKGKDNLRWKEKIAVHCTYCNKTIHVKPSLIEIGKNNFCSRICSTNWKKEHYPKGTDNPFFKQKKTQCAFCGKEIWLKRCRIKKFKNNFCSRNCTTKWNCEHALRGKDSPFWDGGGDSLYYGENWFVQKRRILKRANYVSEMSGNNGGRMSIHHIIPLRNFLQKFIDLGLKDISSIEISSFKLLPYDLIPALIFEEANRDENLMYLTQSEHIIFEGMPPTFFEEIKKLNDEEELNGIA